MEHSFEEQINIASLFLQENNLEQSIQNYEYALKSASTIKQKMDLYILLGRLYQKNNESSKAIDNLKKAIKTYDDFLEKDTLIDKASIFNNLATLYLAANIDLAIDNYKSALEIYTKDFETGNNQFHPHLANTNFALAEAYVNKKDFYNAKTHFKAAIKLYEQLSNQSLNELKANAHYQLGNIYTEEFNLFDAKINYEKALKLFEDLSLDEEQLYKPFLAAVSNNLGVTFKSMDEHKKALQYCEKALKEYQYLINNNSEHFLPYVAAAFNSLSILHAEMKNFEKAIENSYKTINIYNSLADESPEEYTHYLATSLHNLGLFNFELKKIDLAEKYFNQALTIRKDLAKSEPKAFDADVCATALNLVELYQTELENKIDFNFKTKCLELLEDVNKRLQKYDKSRPVIKTMKSDCQYYLDYFNKITIEKLKLDVNLKKVDELTEEINSTINPKEKIKFQQEIVTLLEELLEQIPQNDKLKNELAYAYNDLSWLNIRLSSFKTAEENILNAQKLEQPILPLKCNLAHSYLLQDNFVEAKKLYLELISQKNSKNQPYNFTILKDFETLKIDGINHKDFDTIKEILIS